MTDVAPEAPGMEENKTLEAAKAEARGVRRPDGSADVPLVVEGYEDVTIHILAPTDWYEGAVEALRAGQITAWVRLASDEDGIVLWDARKKRYRHLDTFLRAWTRATGEDAGESKGSSVS